MNPSPAVSLCQRTTAADSEGPIMVTRVTVVPGFKLANDHRIIVTDSDDSLSQGWAPGDSPAAAGLKLP